MDTRLKTYRLPAELGGGTIVAEPGGYAAGRHIYIGGHIEGIGSVDISIARPLEEVKPPSIDDPVILPLEIPMLQLKEFEQTTLRIEPVGHDSAVDIALIAGDGHDGYLAGRLLGDDLLHLAQAAWQAWQRANAIEGQS